jgi:hypothetical protein
MRLDCQEGPNASAVRRLFWISTSNLPSACCLSAFMQSSSETVASDNERDANARQKTLDGREIACILLSQQGCSDDNSPMKRDRSSDGSLR